MYTEEQQALLESKAKVIVGCAFPGTGKTYTLVGMALAYKGKKKVLITTFTRKCKKELEQRLGTDRFDITTLHGLSLRIIKNNWRFLGSLIGSEDWPSEPTLLFNFEEELELIAESGRSVKLFEKLVPYLRKFKLSPTDLLSLYDSGIFFNGYKREDILEFIYYESMRKLAGILIPNDFIFFANKLLKFPQISTDFYEDYGLVLIDEGQDLETGYWNLIEPFMWGDCQIAVIGDYNQSIYSFNGGNGLIFKYLINHPLSSVYKLNYNFRSKKRIVDIVNTIIPEVSMKPMSSFEGEGWFKQFNSIQEEAQFICQHPDAVVLARTNRYLDSLRELAPNMEAYTIHQAKGKEWNKVILAGCQENIIPLPLNKNQVEELNLFYVGCSRAKSKLFITCSSTPSKFVDELIKTQKLEMLQCI